MSLLLVMMIIRYRVYGYRGAMTESEEPDWGGTIIIRILTPQSYSRARWFSNNRNVEIRYDRFAASAAELDRNYDRLSLGQSIPIIHLPGPGVFGAGGRYDEFYSNRAAEVLDGAISLIVSEFEGDHIIVSGASSAGLIVAGLLSMRDDIRCAVIASAPLDLTAHAQFNPAHTHYYGSTEPFDPIRHVHSVLEDRDRTIFIGYSETDQVVSSRYQIDYAEALLELGHSVVLESAPVLTNTGTASPPGFGRRRWIASIANRTLKKVQCQIKRNRPANPPYQGRRTCLTLSFAERKTRA